MRSSMGRRASWRWARSNSRELRGASLLRAPACGPRHRRRAPCQQPIERTLRPLVGAAIIEQTALVIRRENDPQQIEVELPGIDIRSELASIDRLTHRFGDGAAELALTCGEGIPNRPGTVVVLGRGADEEAPAGQLLTSLEPAQPAIENRPQSRHTTREAHRRAKHA